jgi:hypothetical protein
MRTTPLFALLLLAAWNPLAAGDAPLPVDAGTAAEVEAVTRDMAAAWKTADVTTIMAKVNELRVTDAELGQLFTNDGGKAPAAVESFFSVRYRDVEKDAKQFKKIGDILSVTVEELPAYEYALESKEEAGKQVVLADYLKAGLKFYTTKVEYQKKDKTVKMTIGPWCKINGKWRLVPDLIHMLKELSK